MPSDRFLTTWLGQNPRRLKKMVFLAGPRQVGKTTLIKRLPEVLKRPDTVYLNWDIPEDQKILRAPNLSFFREKAASSAAGKAGPAFFLLDEIHKNPRWKNFLKGLYDALGDQASFAVTGSARLDVYRRGGDSLLGRYWLFHLFPFTVAEATGRSSSALPESWPDRNDPEVREAYENLFSRGGFPEPFFKLTEAEHRIWANLRKETLVREDLRDLSRIMELAQIQNLMDLLPSKIGSPLSLNSLREDLNTSHPTAQNWLRWLETLYYFFSVDVYSKRLARSLKKEKKVYLYDWAEVRDPGARFENLVALHLKKAVHACREMNGDDLKLHYLRDKEKREVDFLILKEDKPWMLLETKLSPDPAPSALAYYAERLKPRHVVLLTHEWGTPSWKFYRDTKYWLSPAGTFFSNWL